MSKRREDSTSESLAEALSRVMVTREDADHRENFDWATNEGRGDRMPRFLERAIEDVPHAVRTGPRTTYQGRTRRPFARVTLLLSVVAITTGVAVSLANPSALSPLWTKLQHASADLSFGDQGWGDAWAALSWADASWASLSFTSTANAATPRLGFGEVLRNYSEQAAMQAARGHIIVSDLAPGTTLSAGMPVSDTSWSLPQSDLDGVVITFPTGVAAAAMRATVEIPGNTAASSGKFRLEMRQANDPVEGEPNASAASDAAVPAASAATSDEAPRASEPAAAQAGASDAAKDVVKARDEPAKTIKRSKPRPQAALKKRATVAAAASAAKAVKPAATASAADTADTGPSLSNLLPSWSSPTWNAGATPNALTMFSLGGPAAE